MTKKELAEIQGMITKAIAITVPPAIEKTVNGKIAEVKGLVENTKVCLDEHIAQHASDYAELKPFIQAKAGGTFLFRGLVGIGTLAAAWIAIKQLFPSI